MVDAAAAAGQAVHELDPLLVLALLLIAGLAGGGVARRMHVPSVTGNILAGAAMGATLFHGSEATQALQPLSVFAMGLIAVAAGGHFSYRRVHNALRRILSVAFLESLFSFTAVYVAVRAVGLPWPAALLLAALSTESAPASTMAVIREARARGPYVKTLLGVVSLDTSVCIVLFAFARTVVAEHYASGGAQIPAAAVVATMAYQLLGSAIVGIVIGYLVELLARRTVFPQFSLVFLAILLAVGLSGSIRLSPLLTCLALGAFLGNSTEPGERQLRALEPVELLLFTLFFTLAGANIHFDMLPKAGAYCLVYFAARLVGKGVGAMLGGLFSGASRRIWTHIPLGLTPQAGVVIGLVVILEGDARIPEEMSTLIGTIALAAVTLNEIIGPVVTRFALGRVKEAGLDRPRLMEFLQEEYIITGLEAEDKWDALRKLTEFFMRTHHLDTEDAASLYETVAERERSCPTGVGHGAAIPHGRTEHGPGVRGVMGILEHGVDFGSPDGEPVRLVVLIVTPREHERLHLEVLASLSRMIMNDTIRTRLLSAIDPNDAWEVIEITEAPTYNYFLENQDDEKQPVGKSA